MIDLLPGYWQLEQQVDVEQLSQALAQQFTVEAHGSESARIIVLDDYDWDVWQADSLLTVTSQKKYRLYRGDQLVTEQSHKRAVKFWWDFPEGRLREQLHKLIDLRALLPVAVFSTERHDFVLRNSDAKIVARLTLHSYTPDVDAGIGSAADWDCSPGKFVVLYPLRGYHKAFRQAVDQLAPLASEQFEVLSFRSQLAHCGISPANRKDSGVFGLKEHEPAEQAVREMSVAMLQQARRNEKGIVEDVDTEFLHQYRVNLRKTRSLLNLMKKALPEDLYARLKPALSELSGVTNDLRDLDVFLLQRDYYRKLLPDAFAVGLERLFKMIAADREKARAAVAKSLQAKRHEALYDEVLQLLGAGAEYTSQLAQKPIQQVANKKILARYHRICELGAQIDENTPDHEVHELRIEGKKLRYLMEFFAELYPSKRIKKLIKPLKQMQTILGDFNDYSVQQRFLADYEASHKKSAELSAAISGLVAVLHQKQIAERARVQEAFATFGGTELRNEFELMFGKVRQGNTP